MRAYKSFLEWDIMTGPPLVRAAERLLNPVLGKSLVVYLSLQKSFLRGITTGAIKG